MHTKEQLLKRVQCEINVLLPTGHTTPPPPPSTDSEEELKMLERPKQQQHATSQKFTNVALTLPQQPDMPSVSQLPVVTAEDVVDSLLMSGGGLDMPSLMDLSPSIMKPVEESKPVPPAVNQSQEQLPKEPDVSENIVVATPAPVDPPKVVETVEPSKVEAEAAQKAKEQEIKLASPSHEKAPEVAEPLKPTEPLRPVEPVKPNEPVKPVEIVEPVKLPEPVKPVEIVEPVKLPEPVKPVEPIKAAEPVKKLAATMPEKKDEQPPIEIKKTPSEIKAPVKEVEPEIDPDLILGKMTDNDLDLLVQSAAASAAEATQKSKELAKKAQTKTPVRGHMSAFSVRDILLGKRMAEVAETSLEAAALL